MRGLVLVLCALGVSSAGTARAAGPAHAVHKGKKTKLVSPRPAPPPGSLTPQAEALGRGVHALWDGDFALARKTLTPLVSDKNVRNPDYVLYALAQAELLSDDAAAALTHFSRLAKLKSRFADVAIARQADAALVSGDSVAAKKLYEAALQQHNATDIDTAVCRFRIAQIIEAAEVPKSAPVKVAAIAAYRAVYVQHPLHPLADLARQKMTELDAGTNITVAEHITRAKLMTAGRAWPLAVEELKGLGNVGTPEELAEAEYWLGTTLFRMRHGYEEAAQKLLEVWNKLPGEERKAEALFHGVRAQSRADHDDEAIVGYKDVVARFPHSKNAPEASFLIGWLQLNRGRYADAIPALEKTLADYGHSSFNDDARWYLGLSRWFTGDTEGALADFTKLAAMKGELTGGKGAYWRGRALDKLGRSDDATKAYKSLAQERPFTYYAMLARVRLSERKVQLDPFGREPKAESASTSDATPPGELDTAVTHDAIVLRADELLAADLPVEASVELQRGESELLRRYPGRALSVLFDRYARGEDFYRMHRLAEVYAGHAMSQDPASPGVRAWWELVYPRAYRNYVEKFAPTGKNPPEYLYTIMLKESAYNPHDVSYADAIGLLQMIPPTSRKVAVHVGVPYTEDVLYDPEGNIRLGAWYIGHLLQKFKGQIAIGAGSYNAGPGAMMKWVDKYGARPLDEFVELCPYTQTREYMKKALAIYARYAWLYDKEDYLPSLTIDADYLKDDGVDY
jgi:soluble lytic murein transglycosylase